MRGPNRWNLIGHLILSVAFQLLWIYNAFVGLSVPTKKRILANTLLCFYAIDFPWCTEIANHVWSSSIYSGPLQTGSSEGQGLFDLFPFLIWHTIVSSYRLSGKGQEYRHQPLLLKVRLASWCFGSAGKRFSISDPCVMLKVFSLRTRSLQLSFICVGKKSKWETSMKKTTSSELEKWLANNQRALRKKSHSKEFWILWAQILTSRLSQDMNGTS